MAPLDDAALLALWEAALARPEPLRGTALLAMGEPGADELALTGLPLGEFAWRLLGLHARWFGPALRCACECPACGESVEADCDALTLLGAAPQEGAADAALEVVQAGYTVRFRLPTPLDLAHAASADAAAEARMRLLDRCVLDASHGDKPCVPGDLPHGVTVAIAEVMEHADPLADIGLALQCPACGAAWTAALDPARFLLAAVDQAARRIMADVHLLARAYGWTEAETLALGRARRRAYIELAGA